MTTRHSIRPAGPALIALLIALSLGLMACSDDEPLAPTASDDTPDVSMDITQHPTYQAIMQMESGAELLAQLPAFEKRFCPPGARLLLVYESTTFSADDPYIHYEGVGVPLGRHTAYSTNVVDMETFEQHGTTYWTAANGDELVADWAGTFTWDPATGDATGGGSLEFAGGSGRFAGASGPGGYAVEANLYAGEGLCVWYGWIMPGD